MTHRSRTGACSLCGWREGDGVRECYYDERLGSVQHGNRYPTGLTEEQAALYGAYEHPLSGTLHYLSGEHRAQDIQEARERREQRFVESVADAQRFGWPPPDREQYEGSLEAMAERMLQYPLLSAVELQVLTVPHGEHQVYVFPPHPGCGGRPRYLAPYYIGCTGCSVEIKLWEHGIDYDVG